MKIRNLLGMFVLLVIASLSFQAHSKPVKTRSAGEPLHVLFIGNSYTYSNNLPAMLAGLSKSNVSQREIQTAAVAVQDATLQAHWEKGDALRAIRQRKWDVVVLQEHSLRPVQDAERMTSYARRFDKEIRKSGARTVMFLTWARRDKPEMQTALNDAYLALAEELQIEVVPVGPAWQAAFWYSPRLALHTEDGSHPSPAGTYLSACVFYLTLLQSQQQCPLPERVTISQEDLAILRTAAAHASASLH